jgi:hypothetical protein
MAGFDLAQLLDGEGVRVVVGFVMAVRTQQDKVVNLVPFSDR